MELTKKEIAEDLENVLHDLNRGEIFSAIKYLGDIIETIKKEESSETKT